MSRPAARLRSRLIKALRLLLPAIAHTTLSGLAGLIRLIPQVRKIDADKEVRLKELELDSERDRLAAVVRLSDLAVRREIALKALSQTTSAHHVELIKALAASEAGRPAPSGERPDGTDHESAV